MSHHSLTFSINASVLETSGAYFSVQFNITALRLVTDPPLARPVARGIVDRTTSIQPRRSDRAKRYITLPA